MLLFCILLLPVLLTSAESVAKCVLNANLEVYKEPVTQHGITYEKNHVNKSVPASVTYAIARNEWKVESISWKHNDNEVKVEDEPRNDVYYATELTAREMRIVLHFRAPTARLTGTWTVTVRSSDGNEFVGQCSVNAAPVLKPRITAARGSDGYPLSVPCEVESLPLPDQIRWERVLDAGKKLVPVESNVTYKDVDGVRSAEMNWATARTSLNGFYFCHASAYTGNDTVLIEVRVKDKWALVWPCIGIAAEVLVLLVTILVYERIRAKKRKADDDEDTLLKASAQEHHDTN